MLKKLFLLLLVVAPLSMVAQDKFAYINSQEIFSKMPELPGVQAKLKAKSDDIQKKAAAIEKEYTDTVTKYTGLPKDAPQSEREDLEKQIQQIQERFETFRQASAQELQKEEQTLVTPLYQKLQTAIKEVGDEHGYTYIIDSASQTMVYISTNATDVSKLVKTKLGITE